jgi:hypothetical protein
MNPEQPKENKALVQKPKLDETEVVEIDTHDCMCGGKSWAHNCAWFTPVRTRISVPKNVAPLFKGLLGERIKDGPLRPADIDDDWSVDQIATLVKMGLLKR